MNKLERNGKTEFQYSGLEKYLLFFENLSRTHEADSLWRSSHSFLVWLLKKITIEFLQIWYSGAQSLRLLQQIHFQHKNKKNKRRFVNVLHLKVTSR